MWVSEDKYPITVALLHLWAYPYSVRARRFLAYRLWSAMQRGLPSILE